MGKKPFVPNRKERVESEDDEVVVRSDRTPSVDSEEEKLRGKDFKKRSMQDQSGKNKLKLGEFHRYNRIQKKSRKTNVRKQIRDLERLLSREGLPEEIVKAKKEQLRELKKQGKKQKEAQKFELKYKKIKFTEKRKVIRVLEKVQKQLKEDDLQ